MEEVLELGLSWDRDIRVRQLLRVTPELLPSVWPLKQLWLMNDEDEFLLAALTELTLFPKRKILNILWIGGEDLKDGVKLLDCVEMWARKQGATKVVCQGRIGFERVLKAYGYRKRAIMLDKDISEMKEH